MTKKNETIMRDAGLNPAIPHLIFSRKHGVLGASKRMCIMLGVFEGHIKTFPLRKMMSMWTFANQDKAGSKLFEELVSNAPTKFQAQHSLHNYVLESYRVSKDVVVITAKLLRKGDLLSDKSSRQELFRTLSHEIRTTSMSLDGYVKMLDELYAQDDAYKNKAMIREVLSRLSELSKRLSNNVEHLDSLKSHLEDQKDAS